MDSKKQRFIYIDISDGAGKTTERALGHCRGQVNVFLGLSSRLCRDITTGLMRYGGVSKEKYEKLKKEKKSYDNNIYLL